MEKVNREIKTLEKANREKEAQENKLKEQKHAAGEELRQADNKKFIKGIESMEILDDF